MAVPTCVPWKLQVTRSGAGTDFATHSRRAVPAIWAYWIRGLSITGALRRIIVASACNSPNPLVVALQWYRPAFEGPTRVTVKLLVVLTTYRMKYEIKQTDVDKFTIRLSSKICPICTHLSFYYKTLRIGIFELSKIIFVFEKNVGKLRFHISLCRGMPVTKELINKFKLFW